MNKPPRVRAFSLVEMLIALAITATLLTATMAALDTSFKSYKVTTEGASTNVVSRLVMHRIMTMVRTGAEFGPYPTDVFDSVQNPVISNYIEFTVLDDEASGVKKIVRIERRDVDNHDTAPYELWYVQTTLTNGAVTDYQAKPLLTNLAEARFTLEYDAGPRLRRATVDLTVRPNDFQDAAIHTPLEAPSIRLVSSVVPRRLD